MDNNSTKVTKKIVFNSIQEANAWLEARDNIAVRDTNVDVGSKLGLVANHPTVKQVSITYNEYPSPVGFIYGMDEVEVTKLLKKANANDIKEKWKKEHPGYEVIWSNGASSMRGDMVSLALGVGNYSEHLKIFILWTKKKDPSAPINKKIEFSSVLEANGWFAGRNNVLVRDAEIELNPKSKSADSSSLVQAIYVTYDEFSGSVGYMYGMDEKATSNPLETVQPAELQKEWENEHPGCNVIWSRFSRTTHGKTEYLKIFVIWSKKIG